MGTDLAGRSVLVVGASAGIGRAFAEGAIAQGARVVAAARRGGLLEELVVGSGGGVAIEADVTERSACEAMTRAAVEIVGPLDLVLYSVGAATMVGMADCGEEHWQAVLRTNVIGLDQVIRSALPRLAEGAIVAALSSDIVGSPRAKLGPYGASKAAADQLILGWREEHPEIRFTTVTVGGTMPTGFGDAFDPDLTVRALEEWLGRGRMQRKQMDTAELARALAGILAAGLASPGVAIEHVRLRSPSAPASSMDELEW